MKKHTLSLCILLLCSFLLCACAGSGGSDPAEEIVGKWALINNEEYKDLLQGHISDDIFFTVFYIFNADGTGSTHINKDDDLFTFQYTYDGSTLELTYDSGAPSQTIPCTIKGREMHVMDQNEEVIFYRQPE